MSISATLENFLRSKGSQYEVVQHPLTHNSIETAEMAHIPGDRLAKTVLLEDEHGYVAAVLPSTHHIWLSELCEKVGRGLTLADESEIRELFKDCDAGAVPPVGSAYGMQTYLDESLTRQPDIYFEAGDHQALIHMQIGQFLEMMDSAERVRCAHRI